MVDPFNVMNPDSMHACSRLREASGIRFQRFHELLQHDQRVAVRCLAERSTTSISHANRVILAMLLRLAHSVKDCPISNIGIQVRDGASVALMRAHACWWIFVFG